jgi:hypothetical protein
MHTLVEGIITLSGNYGTAGSHGEPLDFTGQLQTPTITLPQGTDLGPYAPFPVILTELTQAGAVATGYEFKYNPGPSISTVGGCTPQGGVVQILGTGAASGQGGTEITPGSAYASFTPSLSGVQIHFLAYWPRG